MTGWYREQQRLLAARDFAFRTPVTPLPALPDVDPWPIPPDLQARIANALEELRRLHEEGEINWSDVSAQRALEWAFLDDLDDGPELLDAA